MKQFSYQRVKKPQTNVFDLSHEKKMTLKMGQLVPVLFQEVLPGDKFNVKTELVIRLMPLLAPIMHRVSVHIHYFFVPNRLVWSEWEKFITSTPEQGLVANFPKITGTYKEWYDSLDAVSDTEGVYSSLPDYFRIPVGAINTHKDSTVVFPSISQLPFRAYGLIYNDYYRDQNLQDEIDILKDSSNNVNVSDFLDLITMRRRNWEKDYFTSALSSPQKGAAVTLPLGDSAPVFTATGETAMIINPATGLPVPNTNPLTSGAAGQLASAGGVGLGISNLIADLSGATASTINSLRRAFALQRWQEKNMRGGSRYIEHILNHFGVKSSDARLQRPEYLGGGKLPIQISEVLQTSESGTTEQGNMSGHAFSAGVPNSFTKFFEEHGMIVGILSVMPRTAYSQGIPKIFSKQEPYDFYWHDFANIGEEPLKGKELFVNANPNYENSDFGYQPRYQEYRFEFDSIHGEMRNTLKYWHMGREFATGPVEGPGLNSQFIECNPSNVPFPVPDASDKVIVQLFNDVKAIRRVAEFGEPI